MFRADGHDTVATDQVGTMDTDEVLTKKVFPLGDTGPVAEAAVFLSIYPDLGIAGFDVSYLSCRQRDLPVFGIECDHLRLRRRVLFEEFRDEPVP